MKRYWIVARHEIVTLLRRKSFVFFAFIFPLLMIGLNFGITYLTAQEATETGTLGNIGYIDHAGVLAASIQRPPEFQPYANETVAQDDLAADQIGAYFVIPADYISNGIVNGYTYSAIPPGIENQLREFLRANLLADHEPLEAERLQNPAEITMSTLDGSRELTEESALALIMTPMVFAMVLGMSIAMTSSYLMQNVAEEKTTRMVELMMTSITPLEMLWGKILGLGAMGLMQIAVWAIASGVIFIVSQDAADMLASIELPASIIPSSVLYLLLGYLLYGSLLAGIGASSSSVEESQSISGIFTLIAFSPIFVFITMLKDPSGPIPLALSFFPFTSSTEMIILRG